MTSLFKPYNSQIYQKTLLVFNGTTLMLVIPATVGSASPRYRSKDVNLPGKGRPRLTVMTGGLFHLTVRALVYLVLLHFDDTPVCRQDIVRNESVKAMKGSYYST